MADLKEASMEGGNSISLSPFRSHLPETQPPPMSKIQTLKKAKVQQLKTKVATKVKPGDTHVEPSLQSVTNQNLKILPKKMEEAKKKIIKPTGLKIDHVKDVTSPSQRYATANTLHENQMQQKEAGTP